MSLDAFWQNVRSGARLLTPGVTADAPRIDSADIERILKSSAIWLTRRSLEGFDPRDFDFLVPAEREALAESVARFREVAQHVPSDKPASEAQLQQALPAFQRVVEILRPDKYADPEALVLGKRIEQHLAGQIPDSVWELRFETGEDSSGGPALWIWVVLKDEVAEKEVFLRTADAIHRILVDATTDLGIEQWPYIRFRTNSELLEPAGDASK
jgi:hypothetical protein